MVSHMMSVFPTATFHAHSDCETWKDDITTTRLEPSNGRIRVPDGPGLGVHLDRAELERLSARSLGAQPPRLVDKGGLVDRGGHCRDDGQRLPL